MDRTVPQYQLNEIAAIVFGVLSLLILVISAVYSAKTRWEREKGKYLLSSFHTLTIGVFFAVVCLFIPIYYTDYDFGESFKLIRPLLVAVHHALRVFILDGEFDTIRDAVLPLSLPVQMLFSFYAAVLYVTAPVLTFGLVLSLFKDYRRERYFLWQRIRPCYIFSELNDRSIEIASSIYRYYAKTRSGIPMIVFTDVFSGERETDYELMLKAHEIDAICLKKDITRLSIRRKKNRVEFFLMGDDESENIGQAIRLTQAYKDCTDKAVSIYLYSSGAGAGYVLDSLDKGVHSLQESVVNNIKNNTMDFLRDPRVEASRIDTGMFVRRIDNLEALAQRTLTDRAVTDRLFLRSVRNKTVSILILGMGSIGVEFLKTALWLYQVAGYRLEINIVDASVASNGARKSIRKKLAHLWPGIIDDPEKESFVREEDGFAHYDIRFFENVDCFTSDFDRLFREKESAERLRRTQLAVVTLGNDDKNIEAAVSLRVLFDRLNGITNQTVKDRREGGDGPAEEPMICSVVYDQQKAENLHCNTGGGGLINYRRESFGINFIGSLQSQFTYDEISRQNGVELEALRYHLDWLRKDAEKRGTLNREQTAQLKEDVLNTTKAYMDFEYYRKSSIASALHVAMLYYVYDRLANTPEPDAVAVRSLLSDRAEETEHMRWDVYMMTLGYQYAQARADRAKLHPDLRSRDRIDPLEWNKDRRDQQ